MERQVALSLTIIFSIIFGTIDYYGVHITLWSSIVFTIFTALILLNIFYSPSQMATDNVDFTLILYAFIQIGGSILLSIYVAQKTLTDTRQ